jgi:hypothetical protein
MTERQTMQRWTTVNPSDRHGDTSQQRAKRRGERPQRTPQPSHAMERDK